MSNKSKEENYKKEIRKKITLPSESPPTEVGGFFCYSPKSRRPDTRSGQPIHHQTEVWWFNGRLKVPPAH